MNNSLVKLIESSNLEKSKADQMLAKFGEYSIIAEDWGLKAKSIVVTSADQVEEMRSAREGRLLLKQKRVDIEKTRKEMKEQSLREGQAIDKIAKALTSLIEPTEKYLEEQEKFVEIQEEKRKQELKASRIPMVLEYEGDPNMYRLDLMSEEKFNELLMGLKSIYEAKIQAERDRIEQEKKDREESERVRKENEKLRQEKAELEKKLEQKPEILPIPEPIKYPVKEEFMGKPESTNESQQLLLNIDLLFRQIGNPDVCKGCGRKIWWIIHRNLKPTPYTETAQNHFIDCPKAKDFKK